MDFHALPRRDLQALSKRNGIRANMTNGAMADALAALPAVDGIEEYVQQPVAEPTPAAEPEEEEAPAAEKQEISRPGRRSVAHTPDEVIVLDDSEEEKDLTPDEDEEKEPALGVGRRRQVAWAEPIAATARKRAAARKANTAEAVTEAVPARATRARSQRTVESAAEDEAPKTRRASTRAARRKAGTQQEEEEKGTHGDVSDTEATVAAPVEEQSQEDQGETEKEAVAAEAVPARATRARRQRTVLSVAEEDAPKTRRTSRTTVAKKNSTEQEDGEKATQGDVSDMEVAVPAPVSSDDGGDGAEEMEEAMDTQNEELNAPAEEQSQEDEAETEKEAAAAEAMPARATRARSQRTAVSAAAEEAPKARRTTRRAVARKTCTEQEEEEKGAQESGDVPDMGAAVPAPVSSDEGGHDAEEMEAAMNAQHEELTAAEAVPVRTTRARRQRTVAPVAEDEPPKARRTTRRAVARKTGTQQEEEEKGTHDERGEGSEEMDAAMDAQNEEQYAAAEAVPARTTCPRSQRTVVSMAEEVLTKTRRTSRRAAVRKTSTGQEEEEKETQGVVADIEVVPAPVSSDEEADGSEEMEAAIDAQTKEQNKTVEEPIQEGEGETGRSLDCSSNMRTPVSVVKVQTLSARRTTRKLSSARRTGMLKEEEAQQDNVFNVETAVPALHSSDEEEEIEASMDAQNEEQKPPVEEHSQEDEGHASEENKVPTSKEVLQSAHKAADEQGDIYVEDMAGHTSEKNEDCIAEEEALVEELVDVQQWEATDLASEDAEMMPVNEHASQEYEDCTVAEDVQQCEATKDIQLASEDTEMMPVNQVPQATEEFDCTSDVDEEDEEFEEEKALAEEIHLVSEDTEMVPVNEVPQVTEEVDCTSDVDEENEEFEEQALAEPLVDAQCEATDEIQLASEDTEMVPVLEFGEATEEVDFTSDVDEESEEFEEEPALAEHVDSSVQEPLVNVQQCEAIMEIQLASEHTEMVPVLESVEATEEFDFSCDVGYASEENEVPTSGEILQSAAKAVEENEDMAAEEVLPQNTYEYVEEEAAVVTDEMAQTSEAMDEGVAEVVTIDYLLQATVTDHEVAVKESGFSCDLTDVFVEEMGVVTAEGMPESSAIEENNEEVVAVDNQPQATVTDHEVAVKESGFSCDLTDVFVEEMGVVAAEGMPESSAIEENAEEVDQPQATVTDEEDAVKESGFTGELTHVSIEEQGVVATDEMLPPVNNLSQATVTLEELVTVNNLSQATETDDEAVKESAAAGGRTPLVYTARDFTDFMTSPLSGSVTESAVAGVTESAVQPLSGSVTESAVAGGRTPMVATARNFTDHITSPWSANVFEYATKSLSINSITVKPMVSQPADVQLCMYSSSGSKKDATEPVELQRENEVKDVNEPEAAFDKIIYSPLTIRKLRRAVAEENEADGVPHCIFISSSGAEDSAEPVLVEREKEVNEPEAAFGKIIYSPLTMRKLRRAVAEENEVDGVPPCIFISSSGGEENSAEPVLVEREKEVNEQEIFGGSLSLRKLRTEFNQIAAVAQENEVKKGEKSSLPLDKLSLRKLRTKLKETLNAHKNVEPKRVPLGRLDENAC